MDGNVQEVSANRQKRGVSQMSFDHSLITGMFIGLTIGLWYTASLTAYLPFFVIGAVILLLRYVHGK